MALKVDYVVKETAANLSRNITLTLATMITVAISLALVGAALLLRHGVENAALRWRGDVEFIVYMQPDASNSQLDAIRNDLTDSPQIKDFRYLDHDEAYAEFLELFEDQPEMTSNVTPDVLPTSFKVVPNDASYEVVRGLVSQFKDEPGVFEVIAATETIKTMQRMSGVVSTGILVGALVLAGAALVLITNTIRMAMYARRREIEVMKLVGATNWFIRVPFMLEGLIQGLVGAGVGIGLIYGLNALFSDRLASAEGLELLQNFVVNGSDVFDTSMLVLMGGCLIGVAGSGFAVTRFLDV